ncbi:hypothetical protein [Nocardia sp. NPDC052566]|uniref:hypothetical protein n=1 Tax=Nocardia sp. NPDC052566 TaxID=3364330 RepID=UPI0037CBB5E6
MDTQLIVLVWAVAGLVIAAALLAAMRWIGRERSAAWLVVLGLVLVAVEEPLLTAFWALSTPETDHDGIASFVTKATQAHVLDSALLATAGFFALGCIALTRFRRAERWAVRAMGIGWLAAAAIALLSTLTLYPRGLPIGAAPHGYGWPQLAVGFAAWAAGLWLIRQPPKTLQP